MNKRVISTLAAACLAGSVLVACSDGEDTSPSTGATPSSTASSSTETSAQEHEDHELSLVDGHVRAKGTDKQMTAIFGTLVNDSDADITITGGSTNLDGAKFEMHETIDGKMQEMTEPLVIPAGGERELAPGGDHFMIMGYADEIPAGSEVSVTLNVEGGDDIELGDVPVVEMLPGDEDYGEDGSLAGHDPHAGHDSHSGH